MLLKGKCEIVEMLMGLGALLTALFFPEDPGAGVESVQKHLKGVSWGGLGPPETLHTLGVCLGTPRGLDILQRRLGHELTEPAPGISVPSLLAVRDRVRQLTSPSFIFVTCKMRTIILPSGKL